MICKTAGANPIASAALIEVRASSGEGMENLNGKRRQRSGRAKTVRFPPQLVRPSDYSRETVGRFKRGRVQSMEILCRSAAPAEDFSSCPLVDGAGLL